MQQTGKFQSETYFVPAYDYIVTIVVNFNDGSQRSITGNFKMCYNGLTTREIIEVIKKKTQNKINTIELILSVSYCISDDGLFTDRADLVTIENILPKDTRINDELLNPLLDSYIKLRVKDITSQPKMPVTDKTDTLEFKLPNTEETDKSTNAQVEDRNSTQLRAIRSFLEIYICGSKDKTREYIEKRKLQNK